jgi:hypothetical protein
VNRITLPGALSALSLIALTAAPLLPASTSAATPQALGIAVSVSHTASGSVPFDAVPGPGFDVSPDDEVLRSHDAVTYTIEMQLRGAAADDRVVVRQRLSGGLIWPTVEQLPGYCASGSTVSEDRTVVECLRTDVKPNSVSSISLTAVLATAPPHGTVLAAPQDGVEVIAIDPADGSEIQAKTTTPDLVVSSSPRVNVGVKRGPIVDGVVEQDGTPGWYVAHDAYLSVTDFATDEGRGARGSGNVADDVTFRIDLSGYPAGARLATVNPQGQPVAQSCLVGAFDAAVFPKPSGGGADGVSESGAWSCVAAPDGRSVSVTISGADLSGDHIPSRSASGAAITTQGYLAVGRFGIFVPESDVPANGALPVRLDVTDLDVTGVAADGTPLPNAPEPLTDNSATATIAQRTGGGEHTTRYADRQSENRLVPGQSTIGSGDGPVVGGQSFEQAVVWNNTTSSALTGAILCAVFDPATQRVGERPGGGAPAEATTNGGRMIIEYGTTPSVDAAADAETRQSQMDATTCDDGDDSWVSDPEAVDTEDITKVRLRPASGDLPTRTSVTLWVQLQALADVEVGGFLTETYSVKSSGNGPDRESPTSWVEDGWWHGRYRASEGNGQFPRGDQLIAANAAVAVNKRATAPEVAPGAPAPIVAGASVTFALRPQIITPDGLADRARGVTVTDSLPAGLTFDEASAAPSPTSVEPQADGSTVLTWDLGDIRQGSEPVITYTASSDRFFVGQVLNRVIVSTPDDPGSPEGFPEDPGTLNSHYSWQSVIVSSPSGMAIDKQVARPVVEAGDPLDYDVVFMNMSSGAVQRDIRMIDVLPYPTDERGSTEQGVLAAPARSEGVELRYTAVPGATVAEHVDPLDDEDFGELPDGARWCTTTEFGGEGCPASIAEATAILATVVELAPYTPVVVDYTLDTRSAAPDAVFVNDAVVHSATQTLGAQTHQVAARLVSTTIGERIWWDADGDGIDDDGPDGERGPGVRDVVLELHGTDKHGATVSRTETTDADGAYRFESVISGAYRIDVRLPDGSTAEATGMRVGDDELRNSAIDPEGWTMPAIEIPDPAPTGSDALDLRWNGGILPVDGETGPEPEDPGAPPVVPADDAGQATDPGPLAVTGAGLTTGALVVAGVLLLGGLSVLALRRRRRVRDTDGRPGVSGDRGVSTD